jgi:hypothetical protein
VISRPTTIWIWSFEDQAGQLKRKNQEPDEGAPRVPDLRKLGTRIQKALPPSLFTERSAILPYAGGVPPRLYELYVGTNVYKLLI